MANSLRDFFGIFLEFFLDLLGIFLECFGNFLGNFLGIYGDFFGNMEGIDLFVKIYKLTKISHLKRLHWASVVGWGNCTVFPVPVQGILTGGT